MKILITGCKGQLGHELIKQLSRNNCSNEIIETDIHNLDITNQAEVFDFVSAEKPDAIINCAAYTNVDACEKDEKTAFRINAIGAQNLSVASYKTGGRIMHVSTDYVFDGKGDTPKKEFDATNPQSCYGRSKAWGEQLVRQCNPKHYIVRTAWLYGEGNNFVRTILKLAAQKDEISVVHDQVGSPTSTFDLAHCMLGLLETESYGTYHGTCEGCCSWYEFARKIFEFKGLDVKVNKITTEQLNRPANRPKYSVLDNYMLKILDMNFFRHWEEALKEYLKGENLI